MTRQSSRARCIALYQSVSIIRPVELCLICQFFLPSGSHLAAPFMLKQDLFFRQNLITHQLFTTGLITSPCRWNENNVENTMTPTVTINYRHYNEGFDSYNMLKRWHSISTSTLPFITIIDIRHDQIFYNILEYVGKHTGEKCCSTRMSILMPTFFLYAAHDSQNVGGRLITAVFLALS